MMTQAAQDPLPEPDAGGSTVLALRSTAHGDAGTLDHLRAMLALFGPVSAGQRVPLPEPESNALEAHAFKFERSEHAEQAAQAIGYRPGASFALHLIGSGMLRKLGASDGASSAAASAADAPLPPPGPPCLVTQPALAPSRNADTSSNSTRTDTILANLSLSDSYPCDSSDQMVPLPGAASGLTSRAGKSTLAEAITAHSLVGSSTSFAVQTGSTGTGTSDTTANVPGSAATGANCAAEGIAGAATGGASTTPLPAVLGEGLLLPDVVTPAPPESGSAAAADQTDFDVAEAATGGPHARTTVMLRHIPCRWTAKDLISAIAPAAAGAWDLLYMPCKTLEAVNSGYAFVNLVSSHHALRVYHAMHGQRWPYTRSSKVCEVRYARIQGRHLLEHLWSNSRLGGDSFRGFLAFPHDGSIIIRGPDTAAALGAGGLGAQRGDGFNSVGEAPLRRRGRNKRRNKRGAHSGPMSGQDGGFAGQRGFESGAGGGGWPPSAELGYGGAHNGAVTRMPWTPEPVDARSVQHMQPHEVGPHRYHADQPVVLQHGGTSATIGMGGSYGSSTYDLAAQPQWQGPANAYGEPPAVSYHSGRVGLPDNGQGWSSQAQQAAYTAGWRGGNAPPMAQQQGMNAGTLPMLGRVQQAHAQAQAPQALQAQQQQPQQHAHGAGQQQMLPMSFSDLLVRGNASGAPPIEILPQQPPSTQATQGAFDQVLTLLDGYRVPAS